MEGYYLFEFSKHIIVLLLENKEKEKISSINGNFKKFNEIITAKQK